MRPINNNSIFYFPDSVPDDDKKLRNYIETELYKIQATLTALADGHIDQINVAPTKPRTGDIRLADGTNWNPGGLGQGVYCYYNLTWNRLG